MSKLDDLVERIAKFVHSLYELKDFEEEFIDHTSIINQMLYENSNMSDYLKYNVGLKKKQIAKVLQEAEDTKSDVLAYYKPRLDNPQGEDLSNISSIQYFSHQIASHGLELLRRKILSELNVPVNNRLDLLF